MMRSLSTHIATVILGVIAGLMLGSCIRDKYEECVKAGENDGTQFVFRISAAGADTSMPTTGIVETMNSIRIIVIDQTSRRLDINEKVTLHEQPAAKNFSYIFIRNLHHGAKQVFLIANEESVGAVLFADGASGIPTDIPTGSLTAMLDYFDADSAENAEADYKGGTFADVLNCVYFKNSYSVENDEIALPYSAYYELNESELYDKDNGQLMAIEKQMYLVPVAAKFDFVFTNFRKEDVCIDDVIISSVNSHNYLNARLDKSEQYRTKPGNTDKMWWIDWLEECARGSQTADDIENDKDKTGGYNGRWGWIRNYEMPVANDADDEMKDISLKDIEGADWSEAGWTVKRLINIKSPSAISKGPYYLPESYNRPASYSGAADDLRQYYSLTFKVHDSGSDEKYVFTDYEIDTLGALFRDTHIIIYVEFYESEAEIYAEIAPWEQRLFLGYVQQDDEY